MLSFETDLTAALEYSKKEDKIVMLFVEDEDNKKTRVIQDAVSELNFEKFPHLIPTKVPRNSLYHSDFMELYGQLGSPCLAFIEKKGIPLRVIHGISDPKIISRRLQETARYCNEKIVSRRPQGALVKADTATLDDNKNVKTNVSESRILFRMPDHNSKSHTFKEDDTLKTLKTFVNTHIKPPFRYDLLTYHPYKQLQSEDMSLREMGLCPSAVIMIVPIQQKNSLSLKSGFTNLFWILMYPVVNIWSYIRNIFQPIRQDPQHKSVRRSTQPKRKNNVHTLRDEKDNNDDDDENKTWNGNSTQQM